MYVHHRRVYKSSRSSTLLEQNLQICLLQNTKQGTSKVPQLANCFGNEKYQPVLAVACDKIDPKFLIANFNPCRSR